VQSGFDIEGYSKLRAIPASTCCLGETEAALHSEGPAEHAGDNNSFTTTFLCLLVG
jgi:hypothetical protein